MTPVGWLVIGSLIVALVGLYVLMCGFFGWAKSEMDKDGRE